MNVIQKLYDHLPQHWRNRIRNENWFDLSLFDQTVSVWFPDKSLWVMHNAFVVVDEDRKELGIFTEHCGYHVLSTQDLEWETASKGE